MLTLQNYAIFTIRQYNILCHFNISFFAVYVHGLYWMWNYGGVASFFTVLPNLGIF